ncbi:hypothetical protein LI033_12060 [bacterium TM223]|uniref:hypothetical protein n=1 Tax=Faecalibacillus intestinalis TaxID=1982626 RepID=UPI00210DCCAC|nr:hypothetical protein [Faecalibacillus intestinalis]MCB7555254.1 hypothetical protein [bacterium TM223]MCQ4768292.1 hypothetical protein [Faecalibacillus intestinalis]
METSKEMSLKRLGSTHENYLRMLILLIPYVDYDFFYETNISKEENLKPKIINALQRYGGFNNLDMINSLIDFYYPGEKYDIDDLYKRILEISKSLLTYHDNRLCIDMFDSHDTMSFTSFFNNKVLDYLEVNKLMSNTLLIAFYNVYYDYNIQYCLERNLIQSISVVNHQLDLVLSNGIAETHTHVVGSIPFERQWNWLAHEIYDENNDVKRLLEMLENNVGIKCQKERYGYKGDLYLLIKTVLILRLIMMIYVTKIAEGYSLVTFEEFINELGDSYDDKYFLYKLLNVVENQEAYDKFNFDDLDGILSIIKIKLRYNVDLKKEHINYEFNEENTIDSFSQKIYKNLIKLFCKDIDRCNVNEYIEYVFQHLTIEHIYNVKDDALFKKIFLYYIRVKNFIHSFITQSSDIKGFLEFQSFFRRQGSIIDIPSHMFSNIFDEYLYENVQFLEIRVGHVKFENSIEKRGLNLIHGQENELREIFYRTILNFVNSYIKYLNNISDTMSFEIPQVGLILHFNKRYDYINKCWQEFYRTGDDSLIRYKEYQKECFLNLIVFQSIRDEIPYAEDYLIEIDAASNELHTEPWVFAPIFRSVKTKYANLLKNKAMNYGINIKLRKSLGITYHVGEVFYSIISGLRHIDEVIEYFGFQNGERLGHATVLGLSLDDYTNTHQIITLPAIELLDNWLWLHRLKSKYNLFKDISIAYFEEKIWDIVHFIYDDQNGNLIDNISIHDLFKAYEKQFEDLDLLNDIREDCRCSSSSCSKNCIFKTQDNLNEKMLLLSRHCTYFLNRMLRKVQININDYSIKKIYKETQQYLIDKIARKGIIIETNPVSNINIGEIKGMDSHPILMLNNSFKNDYNRVMVSVNTDDPGVFSTTLRNQYGYILEILKQQGIPMEKALLWVDQVRKNGLNSTFIYKKRKTKSQVLKELNEMKRAIEDRIG